MSLEGPRILDKVFAGATITYGADPGSVPPTIDGDQWRQVTSTSYAIRGYYDLSGYNWQDLTAFFVGIDVQEEFGPVGTLPCYVIDMITTEYLSTADISQAHFDDPTGTSDLPGFPESTFDMSQVIYARTRTFNSTMSSVPTDVSQYYQTNWGTCQAATSDKVHITRIVFTPIIPGVPPVVNQSITIPPCAYVTSIIVGKEKDLAYLMRQKRSYELAS